MSLQTAEIDEAWRQRCIKLAEEDRKIRQAEWRAKAHAYSESQRIERERVSDELSELRKLAVVLIREWDQRLRAYALTLQDPDRGPAWVDARRDLVAFGTMLQQREKAVAALREHGAAVGWERQPYLERVLASPEPGQLIDRMLKVVEDGGLDHSPESHAAGKEKTMSERAAGPVMVR